MKRRVCFLLVLILTLGFCACAQTQVAALNGPTGMGLVKLMADEEGGDEYEFTLAGSADMITPKLVRGSLDIACVPANLAAVLYGKTDGQIRVLAVNTLGVLYIAERGDTVKTIADLKGRTIYAAGQGSTPQYALEYLLRENGLDPEKDVDISWKSEHAECLASLMNDADACALLPQPFVTVAQSQKEDIRIALDLNREWETISGGKPLITGVVIATAEFTDAHPDKTDAFLAAYAQSVEYVNTHNEEAAALIAKYGIVNESVALKALPYCNIVCITGDEMKEMLAEYLGVLYERDPVSVGGKVPDEGFYYIQNGAQE